MQTPAQIAETFARFDAYTNALYAAIAAAYQCELHTTGEARVAWKAQGDAIRAQLKAAYAQAEKELSN